MQHSEYIHPPIKQIHLIFVQSELNISLHQSISLMSVHVFSLFTQSTYRDFEKSFLIPFIILICFGLATNLTKFGLDGIIFVQIGEKHYFHLLNECEKVR